METSVLKRRLECFRIRPMLWDYALNRLSEGPLERVERHIAQCNACRVELESSRASASLLAAYERQETRQSRTGWLDLREMLISEPSTYVRTVPSKSRSGWRLVAAALAVGLLLGRVPLTSRRAPKAGIQVASVRPQDAMLKSSFIPSGIEAMGDDLVDDALSMLEPETRVTPTRHTMKLTPGENHLRVSTHRFHVQVGPADVARSIRPSAPTNSALPNSDSSQQVDVQTASLETQVVTGSLVPASRDDESNIY